MRLDPHHLLIPLIVAAAAIVLLALDTSADASCEVAKQRFANGQVAQAEKELRAILDEDPDSPCAKATMASVRKSLHDTQCKSANAARTGNLLSRALKGYQGLVAKDPADPCGTKGVAAVVDELCVRAAVLARHKAGEAAHDAYTAILAIERSRRWSPVPLRVSSPSRAVRASRRRS